MNKIERHNYRNLVIIREIGCRYDPWLAIIGQAVLMKPSCVHVERELEQWVARTGNLEFVDEQGYDFSDFSELKLATAHYKTGEITISNMDGKVGAFRIIVYNGKTHELAFFYIPQDKVASVCSACYGKQHHHLRIRTTYHTKNKTYGKLEPFRMATFKDMCRAGHK